MYVLVSNGQMLLYMYQHFSRLSNTFLKRFKPSDRQMHIDHPLLSE